MDRLGALLLFAAILYGSPGPATLSIAASGASRGFVRSLPFVAGIVLGLLASLLVAAVGVSQVLQGSPALYRALQVASIAYIGYLALRLARSTAGSDARPLGFVSGMLVNLLNPKAYVASIATFAQFASREASGPLDHVPLVLILLAVAIVVDVLWCFTGARLQDLLRDERKGAWLRRGLAALLFLSAVAGILFE